MVSDRPKNLLLKVLLFELLLLSTGSTRTYYKKQRILNSVFHDCMIPPSEATKEVRAYVAGPLKQGTSTLAAALKNDIQVEAHSINRVF